MAQNLHGPEGLATAGEGLLYVVEAGAGRLSRVDLATGDLTSVAEDLALGAPGIPGIPPIWIINGVAIGPSGAIYVSGDVENVIYRVRADPAEAGISSTESIRDVFGDSGG